MTQPVPEIQTFNPTVSVTLSVKQYYDFRVKALEAGINFTVECIGREFTVLMEEHFAHYCGFTRDLTAKRI